MKRPAINPRVVRGLRHVMHLANAELNDDSSPWGADIGEDGQADADIALSYLYALCRWYESQHAENGRFRPAEDAALTSR